MKRIKTAIRTLLALSILAVVISQLDLPIVLTTLRHASVAPLVMALALFLTNRFLTAIKWDVLLKHNGISAGRLYLTRLMFVSSFLGIMIPSGLGADVIRLVQVGRKKQNITAAASSVIADRMIALLTLSALSVLAVLPAWGMIEEKRVLLIVLLMGAFFAAIILMVMGNASFRIYTAIHQIAVKLLNAAGLCKTGRSQELCQSAMAKAGEIHASFSAILTTPSLFASVLFMNVLVQLVRVGQIHFIFRALGSNVPIIFEIAFVPMIVLLTLLPLSPFMGIGVKEALFLLFFGHVDVTREVAVSTSLISHILVLVGLIPGAIMFFAGNRHNNEPEQPSTIQDQSNQQSP